MYSSVVFVGVGVGVTDSLSDDVEFLSDDDALLSASVVKKGDSLSGGVLLMASCGVM